jgi:ABC-type branched-subunit amino acid transport system substrate-binding protein
MGRARHPASFGPSVARATLASLTLALLAASGCSLRNVKHDDCTGDDECAMTFGPGSKCSAGYCTAGATCKTGHDCRRAAGGGACVNGACVSTFPTDPACTMFTEPPDLLTKRADGSNAPVVIGGIFSLAAPHDQALTDPIRLAVREINMNGGLNNGQMMGVVFCDNGGPGDMATGTTRQGLDTHAFDYLAGTLGVPYLVGPLTSADSLVLIGELTKQAYPTVIISPSATSPTLSTAPASLNGTRMFWRTCPNDVLQGQVLAANVIGAAVPAIKTVTAVYINDAYGAGLSMAFQQSFSMNGTVNLVPYEATTPMDPTALATLATTADSMGGDAVLLIAEEGSVAISIIGAMIGKPIATKPFFFTDGSMDSDLLSTTSPAAVQAIVKAATGTAPADPDLTNPTYKAFDVDLMSQFGISGNSQSFLAQAYDATYVGAYGVVWASQSGSNYDGVDVAKGMAHLESGLLTPIGLLDWPSGKGNLMSQGSIDVDGTSGPLQFDPTTGEAPGAIQIWGVKPDLSGYTTIMVVPP